MIGFHSNPKVIRNHGAENDLDDSIHGAVHDDNHHDDWMTIMIDADFVLDDGPRAKYTAGLLIAAHVLKSLIGILNL